MAAGREEESPRLTEQGGRFPGRRAAAIDQPAVGGRAVFEEELFHLSSGSGAGREVEKDAGLLAGNSDRDRVG